MAGFVSRPSMLAIVLVMVVWVGACGESITRETSQVVEGLPALLVPDAPEVVTDVVCPEVITATDATAVATTDAPTDRTVSCTALLAGEPIEITLAVRADDTVRATLDVALMRAEAVSAEMATRLSTDLAIATTVVCEGWPVVIQKVGRTFNCLATDPTGTTRSFVATVIDEAGQFELVFSG